MFMHKHDRFSRLVVCCSLLAATLLALMLLSANPGYPPPGGALIRIKENRAFAAGGVEQPGAEARQEDLVHLRNRKHTAGNEEEEESADRVPESDVPITESVGGTASGKKGAPGADSSGPKEESPAAPKAAPAVQQQAAAAPKAGAAAAPKKAAPAAKTGAPQTAAPTYSWGKEKSIRFRTEVIVTNKGSEPSQEVRVHLPMLENSSPYQITVLESVNYSIMETSGRVSIFHIGDLQPGESKSLIADYKITLRTVSLNSTNDTVEKAKQAYNQYAGSGNCHTLATAFVKRCRELGLEARVVTGFTRAQRGDMTAGPLQGCRHSWAEYFVDKLGWVPVDLTFKYFSCLPAASHIVETYADQSIRVQFFGGKPSASWLNSVR